MPAPTFGVDLNRLVSSFYKIPLASKVILAVLVLLSILGLNSSFKKWLLLDPTLGFSGGAHRLTTYAFMHTSLLHLILDIVAIVPLLEKFESENGTLTTAVMFTGPFTTFPAILYLLLSTILKPSTPVGGASVWCFLLFSAFLYQTSKSTPHISIPSTPYKLPILAIPFILIIIVAIIVPYTSILGHICGCIIGFGWGSGLLKFLKPPDKILRWVEDKLMLRTRLPTSYVDVKGGPYGSDVLPMNSDTANERGNSSGEISGKLGP